MWWLEEAILSAKFGEGKTLGTRIESSWIHSGPCGGAMTDGAFHVPEFFLSRAR
jgi:hypothetical protein